MKRKIKGPEGNKRSRVGQRTCWPDMVICSSVCEIKQAYSSLIYTSTFVHKSTQPRLLHVALQLSYLEQYMSY